jgi:CHAT domain-containing protein
VREAIWDPVATDVAGAELVLLVPDGAVSLVCFDALPAGPGSFLAETAPLLHYLSAERDLVAGRRAEGAEAAGLLAVGGPDFDRGGSRGARPAASRRLGVPRGERGDCAGLAELSFARLDWAADEVTAVSRAWQAGRGGRGPVDRLTGADATEAAVKRLAPGHEVLHFATHAFVLGRECASPLLQSGLALAGANRRGSDGASLTGEDGILTAEEIASLDLAGARWVVLSACATGLGRIQAGEGILGLRRAFEVSGAGTLLGSLWDVGDRAAREWMGDLYRARFAGRRTTPAAVRDANLAALARSRRGGDASPGTWGGFVAAGDWR